MQRSSSRSAARRWSSSRADRIFIVTSDSPSQIVLTEIKSLSGGDLISFLGDLGANIAFMGAALSSGVKRLFRVSGRALAGKKGVAIRAKNRKRGTLEAQLQAIVLKAKPMKVSLRQIQVFADDARKTTTILSQGAFDPKAALDHMNMVWANQANITWALGRTDPGSDRRDRYPIRGTEPR